MPKNINQSRFKKFEYTDEVNHVTFPAEMTLGKPEWKRPSLVPKQMYSDSKSSLKNNKLSK